MSCCEPEKCVSSCRIFPGVSFQPHQVFCVFLLEGVILRMESRIVGKGSTPALGSLIKYRYCFFVGLFFSFCNPSGHSREGMAWWTVPGSGDCVLSHSCGVPLWFFTSPSPTAWEPATPPDGVLLAERSWGKPGCSSTSRALSQCGLDEGLL